MNRKTTSFEPAKKPLLDIKTYRKRQLIFMFYAFCLIIFSLLIGMVGYHFAIGIDWPGAFYNASMILAGMGPADVIPVEDSGARIFAGFYALFSGVVFLSTVAVMFAPVLHRFLHKIHLES